MNHTKAQSHYIKLIYLFYYAAYTSFFSFLSLYLQENSYSTSQIGIVFTFVSLMSLISQPLFGYLSDHKFSIKQVVCFSMGLSIPTAFLLQHFVEKQVLAICSILFVSFFEFALIGLIDSWTNLTSSVNSHVKYSVARGMGSLSTAITALALGSMLSILGTQMMFVFHACFMLLALLFAFFFRNIEKEPNSSTQKNESLFLCVKELLYGKRFRTFAICMFMLHLGWRIIPTYLPTIILAMGGDSSHHGIAMFIMTIGIAPIMFFYPQLRKHISANQALLLGSILMSVRILSMCLASNLIILISIQVLEAFSFGILQPAIMEHLNIITPSRHRSLGILLLSAIVIAFCGTLGSFFSGYFLEFFDFRWLFLLYGGVALLATLILAKESKREPTKK